MELNERHRAAESNGRLVAWLGFVGVLAALNFSSRFAAEDDTTNTRDLVYRWEFAVAGAIQFGIMLLLVLWISAGPDRRELLGLRRPRSWPASLGLVFLGLVGVFGAALLLEPILHAGEEQGLTPEGWDSDRAGAFFANAFVIAVIAPIVEELLFRGLGFSLLLRYGSAVAIVGTGVAFGIAHGLVGGFVVLALFGLILSALRSWSGSVLPTILLHSVFNALALLSAVLTQGGS
jgi:membrane protease YdiL (CAAX protease family)